MASVLSTIGQRNNGPQCRVQIATNIGKERKGKNRLEERGPLLVVRNRLSERFEEVLEIQGADLTYP